MRLAALFCALLLPAPGHAQIDPVAGWIGDANRVGVTFVRPFTALRGGFVHFVAQPTTAEDRVVLLIVGFDPVSRRPFPVASSSSCANRTVADRFPSPSGSTCLRINTLPSATDYLLIARPLAAPASGNLAANVYQYNTESGEFDRIAASAPIRARRLSLGTGARYAEGERELRSVEIPGGLNRAFLWVERAIAPALGIGGGPGGPARSPGTEVAAVSPDAGLAMRSIAETDWTSRVSIARSELVVWVAAPNSGEAGDATAFGRMRVVRNDRARSDVDGDGAGTGLEGAVKTCDSESDVLIFPTGAGEARLVRCDALLA